MKPTASFFGSTISRVAKRLSLLDALESIRPFTPREAWNVFRLAAFAEAVGWTLLICGIIVQRYHLPGSGIAVPIAGQIHGTIFIGYFGVLIAVYASLGWPRKKALAAALAGIPPYGTLAFELWATREHRKAEQTSYRRVNVYGIIVCKRGLLVVQSNDSVTWTVPGGTIVGTETPEQALKRILIDLTGEVPVIGNVYRVTQTAHKAGTSLELYFDIANGAAFGRLDTTHIARTNPAIDEVGFVDAKHMDGVQPEFLHHVLR